MCIHRWPLSADSWDDLAVPLATAGYRTIAYDRRGFGRSSQPWNGYDYDTLTDDTDDNPEGTDQGVFDQITNGLKADRAGFFADFFKQFFGVGMLSHKVSQENLDWCRTVAMQASLQATLQCAHSFATTDFRPDLPAFRVPTLIIHGTGDKTVPIGAAGRAAHASIAGSTLLEYDGAPHGLFATEKARLTQDLLDFLGR